MKIIGLVFVWLVIFPTILFAQGRQCIGYQINGLAEKKLPKGVEDLGGA